MNAINCYVYSRIDLNKFTKSLISLCLTLFVDNQAKGSTITRFNFIFTKYNLDIYIYTYSHVDTTILDSNDPAAGSPTAALLRLLNPLIHLVRANSTSNTRLDIS